MNEHISLNVITSAWLPSLSREWNKQVILLDFYVLIGDYPISQTVISSATDIHVFFKASLVGRHLRLHKQTPYSTSETTASSVE